MTHTRLDAGAHLAHGVQAQEWYAYINDGDYTPEQQDILVSALTEVPGPALTEQEDKT